MQMLRSVLALCLTLAILLSIVGCGYSPVKSSKEELATVLTLDGTFEVPYELYRFYFLSELALSEKDPATLNEQEKASLFAEIQEKTLEELCGVYAVFKLAKEQDIDVDSKEFDKYVKEGVISAVEGDESYLGYGDHETYLAEINKAYMNDSVFRFLLRYRYAEQKLAARMRDTGALKSDRETVLSYMNGDECIRVSWIYIPYTVLPGYSESRLLEMEETAKAATDEEFLFMTHGVLPDSYTDAELDRGFYIGRYQLDPYFNALTEAAFSLELGETSSWIDSGDGKYLVRRLPKDESYLSNEKNLPDFTEYYLLNSFYKRLSEEAVRLSATAAYASLYETMSFESIKMPE